MTIENNIYQKNDYSHMFEGSARTEDILKNPDSLQILYKLVEKNPNITYKFIAAETKLPEERVEKLLANMLYCQLVVFNDEEKGYTLTDTGLAILYNFHEAFVKK